MSKAKSDVKVLKGQEAEDKVLEYVKRMNRPYGAVDVAANLKGAVPKTATQKILLSLAEKGELVQKTYGKTTFFVANQAKLDTVPAEKLAVLEEEQKQIDEENKVLVAELKSANSELVKIRATPSDVQLSKHIAELTEAVEKKTALLEPLRSANSLISAEDLAKVDAEWTKWRTEWLSRKKIFSVLWSLIADSLSPQQAVDLGDDLGIELDATEHAVLERSSLCQSFNPLKRKR
ncbi:TBPIP-domain-containing protein [Hymenopellis radicata]|nr:TBPIP-domain-containing protein [Hymenopellis radicata]